MSLLLAVTLDNSVLVAYDTFVMNNSKQELFKFLAFTKHYYCLARKEMFAFVGSFAVFEMFRDWLKTDGCRDINTYLSKWQELDVAWQDKRIVEDLLYQHEAKSTLLYVNQNQLPDIHLIANGKLHSTNTYIAVGSGSAFVQEIIEDVSPEAGLEEMIAVLIKCFRKASHDLFVSGIPHFILIKPDAIVEFQHSSEIYEAHQDRYYKDLGKAVKKSLANK